MNSHVDLKAFIDAGFVELDTPPRSSVDEPDSRMEPQHIDDTWLGLRNLENKTVDELWEYLAENRASRFRAVIIEIIRKRRYRNR